MPLDGHSYLVAQGWAGKGTGLRHGAISRPLAVPQKKNLAGLGKDRDEAFPFWDHLFTAAAKSIQVKCLSDDEEEDNGASSSNDVSLKRTATGILSNRRPIDGTPAHSGTATPCDVESGSQTPHLTLMAQAKRDAAKRGLYSMFFRGPVLGPETIAEEEKRLASFVSDAFAAQDSNVQSIMVTEHIEVQMTGKRVAVDLEVTALSQKKRKARGADETTDEKDDEAARKERKRRKKEEKRKQIEGDAEMKRRQKKKEKNDAATAPGGSEISDRRPSSSKKHRESDDNLAEKKDISERKQRKEEKKRSKALRQNEATARNDSSLEQEAVIQKEDARCSERRKEKLISRNPKALETENTTPVQESRPLEKKKKKRKRVDNGGESG
ncbi:hypothetical protein GALMADRAFT_220751 [Galerina marginata CBS 339.88]|uniref:G-patch domain-containing protein n=1 Tax=Galerina marginata (strain CBS 339.88) TaxID=685588 RepID=A0A067THX2_GALM3|nr:hypothetical protein GALMADRAFT_220751 [Galerina marginata CBS 339.88]